MITSARAPRTLLVALCGLAPLGLSCSSSGAGGSGGSGGRAGTTGSGGSGGATSSGGATASGGATGSGGTSSGGTSSGGTSSGGTSSGGTTGSGGTTAATGGVIGTGGLNGGTGGQELGGRGAAGGKTGGVGGRSDSGGGPGTGGEAVDGGPVDVVVHDGPTMSGGAYVRTGWTAIYMCTGTCPAPKDTSMDMSDPDTGRAFDTSTSTRWSTRNYQQYAPLMAVFPLTFTFDMKEVNIVSKITTAAGGDPYDAPGEMDVLVSLDGTNFTVALAGHQPISPSKGTMDTITFPQPTPARYVQLKATKTIKQVNSTLGDRFWAIADLNVYP